MTVIGASVVLLLIILGVFYWGTRKTHIVRIKTGEVFSFKDAINLTGLPILTFYQGEKKYNFILDTGSNVSYVDVSSSMQKTIKEDEKDIALIEGSDQNCPIATVVMSCGDVVYEHDFRIVDYSLAFNTICAQSGVPITGLIGGDFMSKYNYCLDYCEYVAYTRKP